MGKSSRPLIWLVDPEFMPVMRDLVEQGHTVNVYDDCDGLFRANHDVILSTRAWYCKDVSMLTKYRDMIIKEARKRRYPKEG